jgi:hypothetical protein
MRTPGRRREGDGVAGSAAQKVDSEVLSESMRRVSVERRFTTYAPRARERAG